MLFFLGGRVRRILMSLRRRFLARLLWSRMFDRLWTRRGLRMLLFAWLRLLARLRRGLNMRHADGAGRRRLCVLLFARLCLLVLLRCGLRVRHAGVAG
jgi:hypothetical protein